jgi:hypothetical protein
LQAWPEFRQPLSGGVSKWIEMKKKKGKGPINPRKLNIEDRKKHAKKWLMRNRPKDLLAAYGKKYGISKSTAQWELEEIGFRDEVAIQLYEKDGIEWEYKYDGYTGEIYVFPKGTEDWEISDFY